MNKIVKNILPGLLILTLATPGFAENRKGAVTLSPFVGGYILDTDQHEESRPLFGLRAGYNFTKNLGAEAMFGYALTETKEKYGVSGSREADMYRYGVDILYHFMPDKKFVPFVAIGGGGTNFVIPNSPSTQNHYAGLVTYGGGAKYSITEDIAFRGEVRGIYLVHDTGTNNFEYTAGLTFQFGGERTAAVVNPDVPGPAAHSTEKTEVVVIPAKADTTAQKVVKCISVLDNSHFMFDSAEITPNGQDLLSHDADIMKADPTMKIRISGYTSAAGSEEYNQKLSERRAASAKAYLVKKGVDASRITTIGYGEKHPAVYEAKPADKNSPAALANMRVVIDSIEE